MLSCDAEHQWGLLKDLLDKLASAAVAQSGGIAERPVWTLRRRDNPGRLDSVFCTCTGIVHTCFCCGAVQQFWGLALYTACTVQGTMFALCVMQHRGLCLILQGRQER